MLFVDLIQNTTIEERVALLEIQVADIEGDISILIENDNFLFDEQIIQDQRLFSLEEETRDIDDQLIMVDEDLESEFVKLIYIELSEFFFIILI